MILETAGLSFLGLGAQPPQADLGGMLGDGRNLIQVAPHVATIPGLVILLLAIGINLVGDGIRDVLDPRLKSGGVARTHPATAVAPRDRRLGRLAQAEPDAGRRSSSCAASRPISPSAARSIARSAASISPSAPGEAVGIVGESGSGKTVTALSILRLVATPPGMIVGGEILYRGEDLADAPLARLQEIRGDRIAYVFQDPLTTLNPLMPVGEQIAESVRRHQGLGRAEAMRRAIELMESVMIPNAAARAHAYPHELSGGQRQRIGIAMALANDPEIIVADEPTTALDVTTQAQILKLLNDLRRNHGAALIFISHDVGVIAELCDTRPCHVWRPDRRERHGRRRARRAARTPIRSGSSPACPSSAGPSGRSRRSRAAAADQRAAARLRLRAALRARHGRVPRRARSSRSWSARSTGRAACAPARRAA